MFIRTFEGSMNEIEQQVFNSQKIDHWKTEEQLSVEQVAQKNKNNEDVFIIKILGSYM